MRRTCEACANSYNTGPRASWENERHCRQCFELPRSIMVTDNETAEEYEGRVSNANKTEIAGIQDVDEDKTQKAESNFYY